MEGTKYMTSIPAGSPRGWYECRFRRNEPSARVARWWSGTYLKHTPGSNFCSQDEYTDFLRLGTGDECTRLTEAEGMLRSLMKDCAANSDPAQIVDGISEKLFTFLSAPSPSPRRET